MSPIEYLEHLTSGVPILMKRLSRSMDYWSPDALPPTVGYGEIGAEIGNHLAEFPDEVKLRLRSLIERGITIESEPIQTAMATGLIEALTHRLHHRYGSWEAATEILGPVSLKYAHDWWNHDFEQH
jgi:hypothetical protein